jgi:hypothetical protein
VTRLALLLCLLVAACSAPVPEASTPPGPTIYRQASGGGLLACTPVGFDIICRNGD